MKVDDSDMQPLMPPSHTQSINAPWLDPDRILPEDSFMHIAHQLPTDTIRQIKNKTKSLHNKLRGLAGERLAANEQRTSLQIERLRPHINAFAEELTDLPKKVLPALPLAERQNFLISLYRKIAKQNTAFESNMPQEYHTPQLDNSISALTKRVAKFTHVSTEFHSCIKQIRELNIQKADSLLSPQPQASHEDISRFSIELTYARLFIDAIENLTKEILPNLRYIDTPLPVQSSPHRYFVGRSEVDATVGLKLTRVADNFVNDPAFDQRNTALWDKKHQEIIFSLPSRTQLLEDVAIYPDQEGHIRMQLVVRDNIRPSLKHIAFPITRILRTYRKTVTDPTSLPGLRDDGAFRVLSLRNLEPMVHANRPLPISHTTYDSMNHKIQEYETAYPLSSATREESRLYFNHARQVVLDALPAPEQREQHQEALTGAIHAMGENLASIKSVSPKVGDLSPLRQMLSRIKALKSIRMQNVGDMEPEAADKTLSQAYLHLEQIVQDLDESLPEELSTVEIIRNHLLKESISATGSSLKYRIPKLRYTSVHIADTDPGNKYYVGRKKVGFPIANLLAGVTDEAVRLREQLVPQPDSVELNRPLRDALTVTVRTPGRRYRMLTMAQAGDNTWDFHAVARDQAAKSNEAGPSTSESVVTQTFPLNDILRPYLAQRDDSQEVAAHKDDGRLRRIRPKSTLEEVD